MNEIFRNFFNTTRFFLKIRCLSSLLIFVVDVDLNTSCSGEPRGVRAAFRRVKVDFQAWSRRLSETAPRPVVCSGRAKPVDTDRLLHDGLPALSPSLSRASLSPERQFPFHRSTLVCKD